MDLSGFVPKKTEIKIGTIDFTFTELNIADLAEFQADTKKKRDEANEARRKRLLSYELEIDPEKLLAIVDKPMTDEELEAEMETIEGVALLAYLSLRKTHEGISREQVSNIITPSNIEEITKAMMPTIDKKKPKEKPKLPTGQQ
jgi:hypothetical protein